MATDRRRAAATTLTGAALLSAGGGLRHEGVRRAVDGGTYPRVHLTALKGAKRGKGLYLAGTAVGTVGAAALGSGLLNLTRRKDVEKALDPERLARIKRLRDARGSLGSGAMGLGSLSSTGSRLARYGRTMPHRSMPTAEETARASAAGKKGAQASAEANRERRYGQHRAQQAMNRYMNREFNLEKREKTPLWQEGVAGTADALRDRKASLTTSAPPKARGTQLAVAGGSAAVGSALARLAMRHSSGRAKALVTPIAGALAATASVPLSSRAVQRSTKGEYVVTPTGVRRAKDVIRKPSTKAHMVSSRHGPLRSQVVPSDDRFAKADSFGVQRAKITAAGSTPIVGPYAQAHLAAHYAPAGQKRKAALRQFAMGPGAGMAAGVGAAYGGAALARHHTGVGTKAESALQWRSDKVNAVRNKVGLGDTKPLAETSLRGRVLAGAKANRLAKPLLHNRGTAAAAAVGFLGTRALVSGIGGQAAISRNQRDQRAQNLAKALNAKNQERVRELSGRILSGPNSLLHNQFNHRDEWVPSPVERVHELHWKMNKPSRFEQAAQRGRTPWKNSWPAIRTEVRQDRALDRQMRGLKVSPVRDRAKPRRVGKLDIGGRRENRREKHKLADTKRLNADLATASGATSLASLGLLASRHKAKAIPLSIIGSGIGGTNALIGAHVQRREAHAIDPVKKSLGEAVARPNKLYITQSRNETRALRLKGKGSVDRSPDRRLKMRANGKQGVRYSSSTAVYGTLHKGYLPELPLGNIPRAAIHKTHGKVRVLAYHGDNRFTVLNRRDEKVLARREHLTFLPEVKKDAGADHRDLLRRYGDRGPLPKNIDRDEKMRAYEARYAAHGGKKGEKWQHRANVAEGVRNIALGTGTAALAGLAALKTKRGMAHVARHPIHQHRLDALALASGAVGGGAELYGELARDRRASYASSPGGVAASALTRMRQNTPGGAR